MRAPAAQAITLAITSCAFSAAALQTGCASGGKATAPAREAPMKRYGMVIGVRMEKLDEYKRLHAAVWPDVLKMIRDCNIRNYTIFQKDGQLFSYFEYVGADFDTDMKKMAADPTTQKWWELCQPCQVPLPTRGEGEWWANMEEVFHCD